MLRTTRSEGVFSRQPRAATSSEVIGQSVLFGVTCNGGRCRAGPTAGVAGTPSDYGPRYEPDRGPCYAPDQPLDHRVGGRTKRIHINGHQGPAPLEPAVGVSRRLCARGPDSADWSLYTAGPDNSVRATRLHLLGTAAIIGSGPGWRRRSGAGQGMGRRRRLQQAEPGRAGTKMWRYRKVPLSTVTPYEPLGSYAVSRPPI